MEKLVCEAESMKARILNPPGNNEFQNFIHGNSSQMDESYMALTAHVDEVTQFRIQKGEYIDLSRLLPKDRILMEEDQRMQLIMHNGKSYWVPVQESTAINSYNKWEQAFKVYMDIFARANPTRATELIEYSHIIHTISMHYSWDNVYTYDKDFRLHMSRNPTRNWSIILQQAWSLRLRDAVHQGHATPTKPQGKNNDICRRYNKGRRTYGLRCRYEHRCSYCFKMGHPIINCRRMLADNGTRSDNRPDRSDRHDHYDRGDHRDFRGQQHRASDNQGHSKAQAVGSGDVGNNRH